MTKGCVLLGVLSRMGKAKIFLGSLWGGGVGLDPGGVFLVD